MPNLCQNHLTLWCETKEQLEKISAAVAPPKVSFLQRLRGRLLRNSAPISPAGFLEFLCPTPDDLEVLHFDVIPQLADQPNSYHWRLENWGCRNDLLATPHLQDANTLMLHFPTDYSPPIAALQCGAGLHSFRFRLLYCEPGNGFCGIATESDHEEFEFTFERPPAEEGVPEELIALFGLNEMAEEY